jgi:hypothetical protein
MEGYKPKVMASGDKVEFFFCALSNKTLCLKGEICAGGKDSEERLTVFFCGFVIRNCEKPVVMGMAMKWNKKVWMTSHILEKWLTAFNARMKLQN